LDAETILHHLEELATRLSIEVRYEAAAGRVGAATLRGQKIAIIDADLRAPERAGALATVLADEPLNGIYIAPEVREHLESCLLRATRRADAADPADAEEPVHEETRPEEAAGSDDQE